MNILVELANSHPAFYGENPEERPRFDKNEFPGDDDHTCFKGDQEGNSRDQEIRMVIDTQYLRSRKCAIAVTLNIET